MSHYKVLFLSQYSRNKFIIYTFISKLLTLDNMFLIHILMEDVHMCPHYSCSKYYTAFHIAY